MPDLKELVAPIKDYMGADEDKKTEVAEYLHAELPSVAQVLIDKGAGLGKGEVKGKLKKATDDLKAATEKIEDLETKLEEAQSKGPENEQKLQKRIEKLEAQLTEATTRLATEQTGRKEDKRAVAIERFKSLLGPDVQVRAEYVNEVAPTKYADRFVVGDDGTLEVKQIGSEAAYSPANGKDPIELLAADVIRKAPDWARLSGVDTGGGEGGRGGRASDTVTVEKLVDEKLQGNTYRTF